MFIKSVSVLLALWIGKVTYAQEPDYAAMRKSMVKQQLQERDIYDARVLDAMLQVPRHYFVPEDKRIYAYSDSPVSIGHKQTISQPYMVAFMTQALRLGKKDKVLEIGTGSGYQAAVLGKLVDAVYTIEIIEPLGKSAKELLRRLKYSNIEVKIGDGYYGWEAHAPYDAIMVTAGAEEVPKLLLEQLKDGGRMIIPVGPHGGIRELILFKKKRGKITRKNLMSVRFVPFTRN